MKVTILRHPTEEDWMIAKKCTLVTVGKDSDKPPTMEFRQKLLRANHSPVRTLQFVFSLEDVPYWVSVHLCRHVHAQPFVRTQRNDRQGDYDRGKAPQDQAVTMNWCMNAEELITIAHKRLCTKASPETRQIVQMICDEVVKVNPEFEGLLVPMCEYRGGLCDEFDSCGRCDKVRARVTDGYKGTTIEISVSPDIYARAGRILLRQEDSNYGTMFYPDEV